MNNPDMLEKKVAPIETWPLPAIMVLAETLHAVTKLKDDELVNYLSIPAHTEHDGISTPWIGILISRWENYITRIVANEDGEIGIMASIPNTSYTAQEFYFELLSEEHTKLITTVIGEHNWKRMLSLAKDKYPDEFKPKQ